MNVLLAKTLSKDTVNKILSYMKEDITPVYYWKRKQTIINKPTYVGNLIRWGVSADLSSDMTYNKASAIEKTSNKGNFRIALQQNGVAVPKTVTSKEKVSQLTFPVVVRPNHHQRGKDFLLFNNLYNLMSSRKVDSLSNPYYSSFFPKTAEWRVHIGHGKVLAVQQKLQTSEAENWNHASGSTFQVVYWKNYRKDILDLALEAYRVSGLDFCAVDVMSDPTVRSLPVAVVCEINTSVGADDYICQRYAEYFDWLLRVEPEGHFKIPNDTPARHYVFKHRELQENDYDFNLE